MCVRQTCWRYPLLQDKPAVIKTDRRLLTGAEARRYRRALGSEFHSSARHEAAHAVVGIAQGLPIEYVDINPAYVFNSQGSKNLSLGFTKWDRDTVAYLWSADILREAMATTAAAGVVAEMWHNPSTAAEAALGDLQQLRAYAEQIDADPYVYGEQHVLCAERILKNDDGSRAWSHVTAELTRRRHLTGSQVRALLERAGFQHV